MWLTITGRFLLVLTTSVALAQSPVVQPDSTSPAPVSETPGKGSARLSGYVVDSTLTKAVEFANIALYTTDDKPIDGAVADDKGKFTLNKVAPGTYKVLVSFIGFSPKTISNVVVGKGENKDLGVIRLGNSTRTLREVTVAGQRALVEDKVDRLVYNADSDLAAKGGRCDGYSQKSTHAVGRPGG